MPLAAGGGEFTDLVVRQQSASGHHQLHLPLPDGGNTAEVGNGSGGGGGGKGVGFGFEVWGLKWRVQGVVIEDKRESRRSMA